LKGTSNVREPAVTKISETDAAELEELQLECSSINNPHMIMQMICAYQEEYWSLTKSLEGKGKETL
jgi:hypothetical protein